MYTSLPRLLIEAIIVAVAFVILATIIHVIAMKFVKEKAMTDHKLLAIQAATTSALFHIISEYTHLNSWYCKNRPS